MEIKCAYTELVDVSKLVPNPKNNNKHPKNQIERLAKIIDFQGQRAPIVVSKRSGFIVKGHGRLEAIKLLGWEKCAVDYQDYESEAQEYADMIADNQIATWAEFDNEMVLAELPNLDIDTDMLGMLEIPNIEEEKERNQDDLASDLNEFRGLVYEPTGEKPSINDLYTKENVDEFEKLIKESNATKEEKEFMLMALTRFYRFNFRNIAEYYCHCSDEVKSLFEQLILVIPDGKKLLTNRLLKLDLMVNEEAEND